MILVSILLFCAGSMHAMTEDQTEFWQYGTRIETGKNPLYVYAHYSCSSCSAGVILPKPIAVMGSSLKNIIVDIPQEYASEYEMILQRVCDFYRVLFQKKKVYLSWLLYNIPRELTVFPRKLMLEKHCKNRLQAWYDAQVADFPHTYDVVCADEENHDVEISIRAGKTILGSKKLKNIQKVHAESTVVIPIDKNFTYRQGYLCPTCVKQQGKTGQQDIETVVHNILDGPILNEGGKYGYDDTKEFFVDMDLTSYLRWDKQQESHFFEMLSDKRDYIPRRENPPVKRKDTALETKNILPISENPQYNLLRSWQQHL